MAALWETLELYLWNVLHRPGLTDIADILLVAVVIYQLLKMTRETRGSAVLKGLLLMLLIGGMGDGMSKIYEVYGNAALQNLFLFFTFLAALLSKDILQADFQS